MGRPDSRLTSSARSTAASTGSSTIASSAARCSCACSCSLAYWPRRRSVTDRRAMVNSQGANRAGSRNRGRPRITASQISWVTSSARSASSMRRTYVHTGIRQRATSSASAARSPNWARTTSSSSVISSSRLIAQSDEGPRRFTPSRMDWRGGCPDASRPDACVTSGRECSRTRVVPGPGASALPYGRWRGVATPAPAPSRARTSRPPGAASGGSACPAPRRRARRSR